MPDDLARIMKLSWVLLILLLVAVAVFSVQNAAPIAVHFVVWDFTASAALVIQLAALLGALVGLMVGMYSARTARRNREIAEAERGYRARQESATEIANGTDSEPGATPPARVFPPDAPRS